MRNKKFTRKLGAGILAALMAVSSIPVSASEIEYSVETEAQTEAETQIQTEETEAQTEQVETQESEAQTEQTETSAAETETESETEMNMILQDLR